MSPDILEDRWEQVRGRVKETWGRLTDDELDRIGGQMNWLSSLLQEKYEYGSDEAEAELDRFFIGADRPSVR